MKALTRRSPHAAKLFQRWTFANSRVYWEQRYLAGGTSGAGSYGRLAQFKAETLNAFVSRADLRTVVEFGCGDGGQLQLAQYPGYVGIDVSRASIELCARRFASDQTKRFYLSSQLPMHLGRSDVALSLDVIYHLVEDAVFERYMSSLFSSSRRFVIIYSSNTSKAAGPPHIRHREFTLWIAQNEPTWQQVGYLPNKYPYDPARPDETSFADFYFFERIDGPRDDGKSFSSRSGS